MGKPMLGIGQFGGGGGGGGITNGAGANVIAMSDGTNLVASPLSVSGNNVTGTGSMTATAFIGTGGALNSFQVWSGYSMGLGAGSLYFRTGGTYQFSDAGANIIVQFDTDTTAGNTRLLIWDVDNGGLERVSVGASDSGGAGFKVLRLAN